MSTVLTFHFKELPVRVVEVAEQKLFVIRDICNILGFSNPNRQLAIHTDNKPLYERIRTPGGLQVVRLVPKEDVLKLLDANRSKRAADLARWLQTEVFPKLFPDKAAEAAKALLQAHIAFMQTIMSVPLDQQPTIVFGDFIPLITSQKEKKRHAR